MFKFSKHVKIQICVAFYLLIPKYISLKHLQNRIIKELYVSIDLNKFSWKATGGAKQGDKG